ncbi:MAG: hypothetical protein LBH89_02985, partial [Lactococcus lactis]|nr:hypothetical protein [Lactococcus lactis]
KVNEETLIVNSKKYTIDRPIHITIDRYGNSFISYLVGSFNGYTLRITNKYNIPLIIKNAGTNSVLINSQLFNITRSHSIVLDKKGNINLADPFTSIYYWKKILTLIFILFIISISLSIILYFL